MRYALFSYGILMFEPILQAALGRVPTLAPARLQGYARRGLPHPGNTFYAAITPTAGRQVEGRLLFDLSADELAILDRIEELEKGYYVRATVLAEDLERRHTLAAEAYLAAPHRIADLRGDWLPADFTAEDIQAFLRRELPRLRDD